MAQLNHGDGRRRPCSLLFPSGDVAQLVERLLCKQEVDGSIPFVSTREPVRLLATKPLRAAVVVVSVVRAQTLRFDAHLVEVGAAPGTRGLGTSATVRSLRRGVVCFRCGVSRHPSSLQPEENREWSYFWPNLDSPPRGDCVAEGLRPHGLFDIFLDIDWDIEQEPDVAAWFNELDRPQFGHVAFHIDRLLVTGSMLRMPHSRSLGDGLYELRFDLGPVSWAHHLLLH